jgi:energy-coupling factor transport system substrate-specific component
LVLEEKIVGYKLISVRTILAVVIGAVLMFVLNRFAAIPSGVTGTSLYPGIAILAVFAAVFGPIAGFLIGLIGHTLTDLSYESVWWSWIFSSALFGLAIGIFWKSYKAREGEFGIKQFFIFTGIQVAANVLAYVYIARTLTLLFYNEPFGNESIQGFIAAGLNVAVVLIIGSPLVFCYSKMRIRLNSKKT